MNTTRELQMWELQSLGDILQSVFVQDRHWWKFVSGSWQWLPDKKSVKILLKAKCSHNTGHFLIRNSDYFYWRCIIEANTLLALLLTPRFHIFTSPMNICFCSFRSGKGYFSGPTLKVSIFICSCGLKSKLKSSWKSVARSENCSFGDALHPIWAILQPIMG